MVDPKASFPVEPFRVAVPDSDIDELRRRLAGTRWIDQIEGTTWEYGVDISWLRGLCEYWRDGFDWRAAEGRLNAWPQFTTDIDGLRVHFYDVRSPEPNAMALVLMHGWPSGSGEFTDVISALTNPRAHGGDPADAFHVVVPSLPGFGFSGPTDRRGVNALAMGKAIAALMDRLGHGRYVAQGGDIGAGVAAVLTGIDPRHLVAAHLNLLPLGPPDPADPMAGLDAADRARVQGTYAILAEDAGYWRIQETRPQTVAQALNDSPAGLCGWIVEKYRAWTDCGGDVESAFTRDQLLTNVSVYWFTRTIASSARFYFETRVAGGTASIDTSTKSPVPVGYADYPGEHFKMARAWAEQSFNLVHWSTQTSGGHFPALQLPDQFVNEIRSFCRSYR